MSSCTMNYITVYFMFDVICASTGRHFCVHWLYCAGSPDLLHPMPPNHGPPVNCVLMLLTVWCIYLM